jgi:hypothetical protein
MVKIFWTHYVKNENLLHTAKKKSDVLHTTASVEKQYVLHILSVYV